VIEEEEEPSLDESLDALMLDREDDEEKDDSDS
jgi:hypothetical protein